MSEQMTVVAKLVKATQELGSFAADKHNPQGRYDYISADQVLGRIGKVLAANGVMVIPAITRTDHSEGQTGKGTKSYVCNIEFCMKITDGDSAVDMFWAGSGVDYGSPDKALYKAITSGHKYFLMKLFNVGIGNEDGEHENADAQPAAPQKQPQNGRQAQKPSQPTNGAHKPAAQPSHTADEVFEQAQPQQEAAGTLTQLHELGRELYGDEWDSHICARNVGRLTNGRTENAAELDPDQVQKLIGGMMKIKQQKQAA